MFRNQPNPFSGTTTIAYNLADKTTSAFLIISSISGKIMQKLELPAHAGKASISLSAANWAQGTYACNLVVNGQLADTSILTYIK